MTKLPFLPFTAAPFSIVAAVVPAWPLIQPVNELPPETPVYFTISPDASSNVPFVSNPVVEATAIVVTDEFCSLLAVVAPFWFPSVIAKALTLAPVTALSEILAVVTAPASIFAAITAPVPMLSSSTSPVPILAEVIASFAN